MLPAVSGLLVVNPRSGDETPSTEELREAAERLGIRVRILGQGDDPTDAAREAEEGPLGAAGGDGTTSCVASVAVERDLPFVPVPFGTRNHFARDAGLDRDDPLGALELFRNGVEKRVDVGRAGDQLFLNNASLGLYARLVHHREHHRRRRTAFARLRALFLATSHRRPLGLMVDGAPVETHVLLVANNRYELDVLSIGERERLDEGLLHLYVLTGWSWEERACERVTISAATGRIEAAVDGEPAELKTPVEFRIEPGALRLLVPRQDREA
jgi:diacylglycerol kinase family enzyme